MAFSMSKPSDREVAVFSAARRLAAGDRAAYLDQACVGDAVLRQRVEELLEASEEAGGFLQASALGAQRLADALVAPQSSSIQSPESRIQNRVLPNIGDYE